MAKKKINTEIPKTGTVMDGTVPLTGLIYSTEANLKTIRANETVHHGAAAERILEAVDFRIKNRVYLKLKKGDKLPARGVGDGDHAYIAVINGILDLSKASEEQMEAIQEEMRSDEKETNEENKFESAILSKGYTGYLSGDIIVVLDTNVKVKKFEQEEAEQAPLEAPQADVEQTKKNLPKPVTRRKLTKKEASALSDVMPALQSKAPSASIRGGVLTVNDDEYQSFVKEAMTFPNMPKFINDDYDDQDDQRMTHQAFRAKKLSRQKRKKIQDKELAESIKKILLDENFTKNFSGKISDAFKNFESASKAYQDLNDSPKEEAKKAEGVEGSESEKSETNELLEDIRDILVTLADESVSENAISKDDARVRIQDILEQTKNKTDETNMILTKTLNQVLNEIKNSEIEEDLGIKNKEPIKLPPDLKKTVTETTEDTEDDSENIVVNKNADSVSKSESDIVRPEPKQIPERTIAPEIVSQAKTIVEKHADKLDSGYATPIPTDKEVQDINEVAKKLAIEPSNDWKETVEKIKNTIEPKEVQGSSASVQPKEVQSVDVAPKEQIEKKSTVDVTPKEEPKEVQGSDTPVTSVQPKEVQSIDVAPKEKEQTKPISTKTKPVYEVPEDEDWDTPPRRKQEPEKTDVNVVISGGKAQSDSSKVNPKNIDKPELTPVEKEMEHAKEIGETVPKFKKRPLKTKIKPEPKEKIKNTPRDTYRREETTEDEKTGNKTFTPSFTPIPKNLSGTDIILGSLINKNKDIVTKDADGNEISRRPSANKLEYTKRLIRKGDEYLGRGGTAAALRLFKKKNTVKTSNDPNAPTPKEKDSVNIVPTVNVSSKDKSKDKKDLKKYTRVEGKDKTTSMAGNFIFGKGKKAEAKKPTAEISKFDKQKADNKKPLGVQPQEVTPAAITPPEQQQQQEESSSLLESLAAFVPTGGKGLLRKTGRAISRIGSKAGSVFGKAGKFAGKVAAPLAAGAAVVEGIDDIAEGNKVESISDIIPKGGLLDKLNPFNYVMNSGRYVGDKVNEGYKAVSTITGGSGSLGADIYNKFYGDEIDPTKPTPIKRKAQTLVPETKPKIDQGQEISVKSVPELSVTEPKSYNIGSSAQQEVKGKEIERQDLSVKPKIDQYHVKPETELIADAGMERAAKVGEKQAVGSATNIVSNVTNNSSPMQQIMPNNMMAQRNTENAYQSMNNRKFII